MSDAAVISSWLGSSVGIALEECEQPVGEIGGPGGVGGHEEFDDPQLGIGHGRSLWESNGSRSPVLGVVYVPIHRIHPFHWPPARSAARIVGRPPPGSLALASRQADLDPPGRHLGVFLLADEVDLGGADVGMAGELAHLVHRRPVADGVVDRRLA